MNFQAARLKTFYLMNNFTTEEKIFITMKGFYKEVDRLMCYKCKTTYEIGPNSMDVIGSHECRTLPLNTNPNVDIPSPYVITGGAVNVHNNNLNYEEFRYATFRNWCPVSTTKINPLELAASGFYYAINPQTIKCFYCKIILHAQVITNRTIADHKKNKKCEQRKLAFHVRLNNLIHDQGLRGTPLRVLPRISEQAGPSHLSTTHFLPQIESPMSAPLVQRAFDEFLGDCEKKEIYTKALDLGLDRHLVNTVIKQQLQLQWTFANVEELIDLCYTFTANRQLARRISQEIEKNDREMECKICMSKKIGVIFEPCNHVIACAECGSRLSTCPICCQFIVRCSAIFF